MKAVQEVSPARAYFEGMIRAVFGVGLFRDSVGEWEIDAVKKYAK